MAVKSQGGDIQFQDEIQFLSRDEEDYPQLMRLCLDFDFHVHTIVDNTSQANRRYVVTYKSLNDQRSSAITPPFSSLVALERYTNDNIIDILHDTLFNTEVFSADVFDGDVSS